MSSTKFFDRISCSVDKSGTFLQTQIFYSLPSRVLLGIPVALSFPENSLQNSHYDCNIGIILTQTAHETNNEKCLWVKSSDILL